MAKKKTPENQADTVVLDAPPALPSARYRVALAAQTPLLHPELEVEAAGEEEARAKFMAANNISGSDCDWTISRL